MIYKIFPGPEFFITFVLLYAIYIGRTRPFILEWAPFTILFLGYEAMYGVVGNLKSNIHVTELINIELRLFGCIPTLVLQKYFRNIILDYVGTALYSLHFILPVAFGLILWRYSAKNYWSWVASFLLCSYSALITFLVFPSAPPWYGVNAIRIIYETTEGLGLPTYRTVFDYLSSNPFAAFPSLHSAYPWLISLYAIKIWRVKALPILILPAGIWFSAVYLGEHYVVDVIGGIIFATVSFLIVEKLISRLHSPFREKIPEKVDN